MDVLRRFEGELGRLGAAKIAPPALRPVLGNNYGEDLAGNREVAPATWLQTTLARQRRSQTANASSCNRRRWEFLRSRPCSERAHLLKNGHSRHSETLQWEHSIPRCERPSRACRRRSRPQASAPNSAAE